MTKLIGIILVLLGIFLGLYVGVWWAFIGGIVTVIEECRSPELNSLTLAICIVKILGSSFIGYFTAWILMVPGWFMITESSR